MYLYILNGKDEGKRISLKSGTFRIGRAPENDIVIRNDKYVSGSHAEITLKGGGKLTLADKGSRNGTYLLGEPVSDHAEVKHGDIFRVGRTFLKYSRRTHERIFADDSSTVKHPEAIVVVDIVGSSKIAQAMGDHVASKVKNLLNHILTEILAEYPAKYVKSTGDGYMLIFAKPLSAVLFSIELMNAIQGDGSYKGFHIRIGINYGETFRLEDGDRRGSAVDMAFRVESVKIGDMHQTMIGIRKEELPRVDRIFISEVVQKLIASKPTIKTRCIGFFDLKGFNGRHKIFEILP